MSVIIRCGPCGHRTLLSPASYVQDEAVSLVCVGCRTALAAVVSLPEEIREPEWYGYI